MRNRAFWSRLKANKGVALKYIKPLTSFDDRLIIASTHTSLEALMAVIPEFSASKALNFRRDLISRLDGDSFTKQRKYEMLTYLPDLLMRQDKMSMAHSIENRVPFLDNDLVSLGLNLSEKQLLLRSNKRLESKNLLKEIASNKFSESLAYRHKQGFPIPLQSFMSSKIFQSIWRDMVYPYIAQDSSFNHNKLDLWVKNIGSTNGYQRDMIWLVTSFQLWHNKYIS
jgi:asparagine synthase (glutamine-hydrolysing)